MAIQTMLLLTISPNLNAFLVFMMLKGRIEDNYSDFVSQINCLRIVTLYENSLHQIS